jgi:hypothetical protein
VKNGYPNLSGKEIKVSLPFVSTCLYESGISAVAIMKTKYLSLLVVGKEQRITVSSMTPRF